MSAWITRAAVTWEPPYQALDRTRSYGDLAVGMVIALDYRAWEVMHLSPMVEPDETGRDMRATLRRLHGPKHDRENQWQDMVVHYGGTAYGLRVYRGGRVWLCSCCSHPVPCRMEVAEESSVESARIFEERINRMGPGLCYGCGEVITQRQDRMTFGGEHADFPGRGGPTFHTRRKCSGERAAYAKRAGLHYDGGPLVPPCDGQFIKHGDGTFECSSANCEGVRAQHRMFASCYGAGCEDANCRASGRFDCTPNGTEVRRCP